MKTFSTSQLIVLLFLLQLPVTVFGQDSSMNPIWEAIKKNNNKQLEIALTTELITKEQLNPKCTTIGRCKPLIVALYLKSSHDIIKTLVENGADVNVMSGDAKGNSPLLMAMLDNNKELISYLLSKGADVNKHNKLGSSPLLGTCITGDIENLRLFLKHGANINAPTSLRDPLQEIDQIVEGITPLMMAAATGHTQISDLLMAHGASIGLKDSLGRTAADYRKSTNQPSRYSD